MKIKWVSHPSNPSKNHTFEHVNNTFGEVAVGYGQAERCPRPNYGTKEFLEERAEMAKRAVPQPGDVDPNVRGTEWGVKERTSSVASSHTLIVKRVNSETFYFTEPPRDCPPSIKARFQQLLDTEKSLAAQPFRLERAQQEQAEREHREKEAQYGAAYGLVEKPSVRFI